MQTNPAAEQNKNVVNDLQQLCVSCDILLYYNCYLLYVFSSRYLQRVRIARNAERCTR